jgi:hypothetical protein
MSRRYSLNNLAEIAIGIQLVAMGIPVRAVGPVMERVRHAWHVLADPQQRVRASVLLLTHGGSDAAEYGGWHSSEFATPEAMADWLRAGNSGVCVNVLEILKRLEQATSDTFVDPTPLADFRIALKEVRRTLRRERSGHSGNQEESKT